MMPRPSVVLLPPASFFARRASASVWCARFATLLLPALLLAACSAEQTDATQIRGLIARSIALYNQEDYAGMYRLTDLDFRTLCPRAVYTAAVRAEREQVGPLELVEVHSITYRGVRAWAHVSVRDQEGVRLERRRFVEDRLRWYVYGVAEGCPE